MAFIVHGRVCGNITMTMQNLIRTEPSDLLVLMYGILIEDPEI
jgi:hypothetical protein